MKTLRIIIVLFSLALAGFVVSCDIIEQPYMTNHTSDDGDDTVVRKILLEEFTGHLCPNCPEGKKVAGELKGIYGNRIVEISIHTGTFATPMAGNFAADYRTTAGSEIATFFGVNQYPTGMISRFNFDTGRLLSPSAWGSSITQIIDDAPAAKISITTLYNSTSRKLDVDITTDILSNMDGEFFITAVLVENGLVSPQKTNDPEYSTGIIMDYEHNHVLRNAINSTWGEKFSEAGVVNGDSFNFNYSITLNQDWIADNCEVVVYIYNGETKEVIQVEVVSVQN
jgi:hypothetical protein